MAKKRRIGILAEDAEYLIKLFNIEEKSRPTFTVLFHRAVELIRAFVEKDETGIVDKLRMKWAIDVTNREHLEEKGEQR